MFEIYYSESSCVCVRKDELAVRVFNNIHDFVIISYRYTSQEQE